VYAYGFHFISAPCFGVLAGPQFGLVSHGRFGFGGCVPMVIDWAAHFTDLACQAGRSS
jgi:hypothetical protein